MQILTHTLYQPVLTQYERILWPSIARSNLRTLQKNAEQRHQKGAFLIQTSKALLVVGGT